MSEIIDTVVLSKECDSVNIIDQTLLPARTVIKELRTREEIWNAIHRLEVRGAPAIGVAAAMGIYVLSRGLTDEGYDEFYAEFLKEKDYLASSRPTAVNLFWALDRMDSAVKSAKDLSVPEIKNKLLKECLNIYSEDIKACRMIGENGVKLLKSGYGILTHCNAGRLATSMYGTATSPIYSGHERGYNFKVYCDETRPLLQGARLTAYELSEAGIDTTLICDNMAASLMAQGKINAVLVGADRIAASGDTANKIGTLGVAVLAKHFGIPFYVCAPISTLDFNCESGADIPIEHRAASEVTELWYENRMAPENINVYNPAFDVTPAELITAIITDRGIAYPNYKDSLKKLVMCGYE